MPSRQEFCSLVDLLGWRSGVHPEHPAPSQGAVEPPGVPPEQPGSGAGGAGGDLHGADARASVGDRGGPQGGRRLCLARSGSTAGAAVFDALLGATEMPDGEPKPPGEGGWERHCTRRIHVYPLPGNHNTILREPNVGRIAELLHQILADAAAGKEEPL